MTSLCGNKKRNLDLYLGFYLDLYVGLKFDCNYLICKFLFYFMLLIYSTE